MYAAPTRRRRMSNTMITMILRFLRLVIATSSSPP
jgi:hypothetical protein